MVRKDNNNYRKAKEEVLVKLQGPERNFNFMPNDKLKKNVYHYSPHPNPIKELKVLSNKIGFNVNSHTNLPVGIEKCVYNDPYCNFEVKAICESNDYIVFSEILYDAKPFIQADCQAKIIMHMTKKFDNFVLQDDYKNFLTLLNDAIEKERVVFVLNNYSVLYYACKNGLNIKKYVLSRSTGYTPDIDTTYIENINGVNEEEAKNTFAVFNRYTQDELLINKLKKKNIPLAVFDYKYGGPKILSRYKAVIVLPHAPTSFSLMENIRNEIIYFVPTQSFLKKLLSNKKLHYEFSGMNEVLDYDDRKVNVIDWYAEDLFSNFVYFNSWNELYNRIKYTDYDGLHRSISEYKIFLEKGNIYLWKTLLGYKVGSESLFKDAEILKVCQKNKIKESTQPQKILYPNKKKNF